MVCMSTDRSIQPKNLLTASPPMTPQATINRTRSERCLLRIMPSSYRIENALVRASKLNSNPNAIANPLLSDFFHTSHPARAAGAASRSDFAPSPGTAILIIRPGDKLLLPLFVPFL